MNNNELDWQTLLPDNSNYQSLLQKASSLPADGIGSVQNRLAESLALFCHPNAKRRFMLLKSDESERYLETITQMVPSFNHSPAVSQPEKKVGGEYILKDGAFVLEENENGRFVADQKVAYREWIEAEQLFGQVYHHQQNIQIAPGLIHKVNGGTLILSLRTLLSQPLVWVRLKQMISQQRFDWLAPDEHNPLPLPIESMPLDLRLVLVGDRLSLEEFAFIEPELSDEAIYGEYELDYIFDDEESLQPWCQFINSIIARDSIAPLSADGWAELISQSCRYMEDNQTLPLDLIWLTRLLNDANTLCTTNVIDSKILQKVRDNRLWRHSYLVERGQDEILQNQIFIQTTGEAVGQINGLSVLQYPGHPDSIGEPARITCVAHIGDGEFIDVERKVELGGNIHAKGMMIMQAYLVSELKLDQPFPLSASIVFEQSYGEVDGDSASLAELCALISALTMQPIDQQLAVTGAVDQFGFVQPIGGVNEKIEGFFRICQARELTGQQGVIIPHTNVRNLVLTQDVIDAVKAGTFHIWPVAHVAQAAMLLMRMPYYEPVDKASENDSDENSGEHLLAIIQDRIALVNNQERPRLPWFLRWLR